MCSCFVNLNKRLNNFYSQEYFNYKNFMPSITPIYYTSNSSRSFFKNQLSTSYNSYLFLFIK